VAIVNAFRDLKRERTLLPVAAWALCVGAGVAILVGATSWLGLCENGTFDRCRGGNPSFELVLQLGLAVTSFGAALGSLILVRRGGRRIGGMLLVVGLVLLGTWAVVLDAATHGWDDLTLFGTAAQVLMGAAHLRSSHA